MGNHVPGGSAPRRLTVTGRLRIELYVWELDQRAYDLPYRARVSCRREVRQNLLAAARDAGAGEALRGIGSASELARQYLAAEYGTRPRPHWTAGAAVLLLGVWAMMLVSGQEDVTAEAAIRAVDPHVTGTFTVPGIPLLQHATVYAFAGGQSSQHGGDWGPLFYLLLLAAVIVAGRLWRVRPGASGRPAA